MPRNPYEDPRSGWRSDEGRSNRWRDENEGRYGSVAADRDLADDYRYFRHGSLPHGEVRQGGYGGNYGEGQYGEGGSLSRFEMDHRGKGPMNYQRSDERLREVICEQLHDHPEIDASEMTVSVQDGRVILEGTVDSRRTRDLVEDVAAQISVIEVHNNLRVRSQGRLQSNL